MWSYTELQDLIADAEARRNNAETEWEWESATAELEELYAALDEHQRQVESSDAIDLDSIRNAGF